MNEKRASIEIIAPSVEEAVAKGLEDLGLGEDDVNIEVLDPGTRGLFGLGSRQARIRLTVKAAPFSAAIIPEGPIAEDRQAVQEAPAAARASEAPKKATFNEDELAIEVARDTVSELLEKMSVRAKVTAQMGEPDDAHSKPPLLVDVRGDDLSILIGRNAEILNALQYISSLIIGKELGHAVTLVLDVQGYRKRRELQLRQLARRMADQAVKTGKKQVLEPMPAADRRLIHIELRDHPQVITESVGEDPYRKVTIILKS